MAEKWAFECLIERSLTSQTQVGVGGWGGLTVEFDKSNTSGGSLSERSQTQLARTRVRSESKRSLTRQTQHKTVGANITSHHITLQTVTKMNTKYTNYVTETKIHKCKRTTKKHKGNTKEHKGETR